jgi:hypothetical protein
MAKHRSYSIEFERQVAQEYIAAQFPVVLALLWQIFRGHGIPKSVFL